MSITSTDKFCKMTAGRLVYLCFSKPRALIRQSIREGGPINQLITRRGRVAMKKAAFTLPPTRAIPSAAGSAQVHMLTGRSFWYQSAFCLRSLVAHCADTTIQPVFYDDGTLGRYRTDLERVFPCAIFVERNESKARLDRLLPQTKFPNLHERWQNYPLIRKLIDPHIGSSGWKLVIDSDILFFRRPEAVLEWLLRPAAPLHTHDVEESYGYSRRDLEKLVGRTLPPCLNIGLCGLRSDAIDWTEVEYWVGVLQRRHGTHYLLDQALVAMLVSGGNHIVTPAIDYITGPSFEEAKKPTAAMHHYVALSKCGYFRVAWRLALAHIQSQSQIDGDND